MRMTLALLTVLVLVSGCATAEPKPAVCDGKHRRPANPYGTVLQATPASTTPPAPSTVAPKPPGPLSTNEVKSTLPCGARS
jgi:hypothetical protein